MTPTTDRDKAADHAAIRLYLAAQERVHLDGGELATARHLLPFRRTLHLDGCVACATRHTERHGDPKYPRLLATETA